MIYTHDIDEAIRFSDRIYILGGKPDRILTERRALPPRSDRDKDFNLTPDFRNIREILGYLNR